MFNWRDLSFPPRVVALAAAVVLFGLTTWLTLQIRGSVNVTSDQKGLQVTRDSDELSFSLPHTYRLRPGHYRFVVEGPGKTSQTVNVRLWPWQTVSERITLAPRPDLAKLPLADQLPHFETGLFEVGFPDDNKIYTITLLANPNWYDSTPAYNQALKQDKEAAIKWIASQTKEQLVIKWVPYDPQ